jgi:hypothetical protein
MSYYEFDIEEDFFLEEEDFPFQQELPDFGDDVENSEDAQESVEIFQQNFKEGQEKFIDNAHLDPRNEKDKPYVAISKELEFLGIDRPFVENLLQILRDLEEKGFKSLRFLNPRYLVNAYIYLSTGVKVNEDSMKEYIKDKNNWYKTKNKVDISPYLDQPDFYRYVVINQEYKIGKQN